MATDGGIPAIESVSMLLGSTYGKSSKKPPEGLLNLGPSGGGEGGGGLLERGGVI